MAFNEIYESTNTSLINLEHELKTLNSFFRTTKFDQEPHVQGFISFAAEKLSKITDIQHNLTLQLTELTKPENYDKNQESKIKNLSDRLLTIDTQLNEISKTVLNNEIFFTQVAPLPKGSPPLLKGSPNPYLYYDDAKNTLELFATSKNHMNQVNTDLATVRGFTPIDEITPLVGKINTAIKVASLANTTSEVTRDKKREGSGLSSLVPSFLRSSSTRPNSTRKGSISGSEGNRSRAGSTTNDSQVTTSLTSSTSGSRQKKPIKNYAELIEKRFKDIDNSYKDELKKASDPGKLRIQHEIDTKKYDYLANEVLNKLVKESNDSNIRLRILDSVRQVLEKNPDIYKIMASRYKNHEHFQAFQKYLADIKRDSPLLQIAKLETTASTPAAPFLDTSLTASPEKLGSVTASSILTESAITARSKPDEASEPLSDAASTAPSTTSTGSDPLSVGSDYHSSAPTVVDAAAPEDEAPDYSSQISNLKSNFLKTNNYFYEAVNQYKDAFAEQRLTTDEKLSRLKSITDLTKESNEFMNQLGTLSNDANSVEKVNTWITALEANTLIIQSIHSQFVEGKSPSAQAPASSAPPSPGPGDLAPDSAPPAMDDTTISPPQSLVASSEKANPEDGDSIFNAAEWSDELKSSAAAKPASPPIASESSDSNSHLNEMEKLATEMTINPVAVTIDDIDKILGITPASQAKTKALFAEADSLLADNNLSQNSPSASGGNATPAKPNDMNDIDQLIREAESIQPPKTPSADATPPPQEALKSVNTEEKQPNHVILFNIVGELNNIEKQLKEIQKSTPMDTVSDLTTIDEIQKSLKQISNQLESLNPNNPSQKNVIAQLARKTFDLQASSNNLIESPQIISLDREDAKRDTEDFAEALNKAGDDNFKPVANIDVFTTAPVDTPPVTVGPQAAPPQINSDQKDTEDFAEALNKAGDDNLKPISEEKILSSSTIDGPIAASSSSMEELTVNVSDARDSNRQSTADSQLNALINMDKKINLSDEDRIFAGELPNPLITDSQNPLYQPSRSSDTTTVNKTPSEMLTEVNEAYNKSTEAASGSESDIKLAELPKANIMAIGEGTQRVVPHYAIAYQSLEKFKNNLQKWQTSSATPEKSASSTNITQAIGEINGKIADLQKIYDAQNGDEEKITQENVEPLRTILDEKSKLFNPSAQKETQTTPADTTVPSVNVNKAVSLEELLSNRLVSDDAPSPSSSPPVAPSTSSVQGRHSYIPILLEPIEQKEQIVSKPQPNTVNFSPAPSIQSPEASGSTGNVTSSPQPAATSSVLPGASTPELAANENRAIEKVILKKLAPRFLIFNRSDSEKAIILAKEIITAHEEHTESNSPQRMARLKIVDNYLKDNPEVAARYNSLVAASIGRNNENDRPLNHAFQQFDDHRKQHESESTPGQQESIRKDVLSNLKSTLFNPLSTQEKADKVNSYKNQITRFSEAEQKVVLKTLDDYLDKNPKVKNLVARNSRIEIQPGSPEDSLQKDVLSNLKSTLFNPLSTQEKANKVNSYKNQITRFSEAEQKIVLKTLDDYLDKNPKVKNLVERNSRIEIQPGSPEDSLQKDVLSNLKSTLFNPLSTQEKANKVNSYISQLGRFPDSEKIIVLQTLEDYLDKNPKVKNLVEQNPPKDIQSRSPDAMVIINRIISPVATAMNAQPINSQNNETINLNTSWPSLEETGRILESTQQQLANRAANAGTQATPVSIVVPTDAGTSPAPNSTSQTPSELEEIKSSPDSPQPLSSADEAIKELLRSIRAGEKQPEIPSLLAQGEPSPGPESPRSKVAAQTDTSAGTSRQQSGNSEEIYDLDALVNQIAVTSPDTPIPAATNIYTHSDQAHFSAIQSVLNTSTDLAAEQVLAAANAESHAAPVDTTQNEIKAVQASAEENAGRAAAPVPPSPSRGSQYVNMIPVDAPTPQEYINAAAQRRGSVPVAVQPSQPVGAATVDTTQKEIKTPNDMLKDVNQAYGQLNSAAQQYKVAIYSQEPDPLKAEFSAREDQNKLASIESELVTFGKKVAIFRENVRTANQSPDNTTSAEKVKSQYNLLNDLNNKKIEFTELTKNPGAPLNTASAPTAPAETSSKPLAATPVDTTQPEKAEGKGVLARTAAWISKTWDSLFNKEPTVIDTTANQNQPRRNSMHQATMMLAGENTTVAKAGLINATTYEQREQKKEKERAEDPDNDSIAKQLRSANQTKGTPSPSPATSANNTAIPDDSKVSSRITPNGRT